MLEQSGQALVAGLAWAYQPQTRCTAALEHVALLALGGNMRSTRRG